MSSTRSRTRDNRLPIPDMGPVVDAALTLVTASAAVALVRAFRSWDPLWPLLAIVVLAHGLCWAGRRLRLGALAFSTAMLAIGSVIITAVYYRDISVFGLPTPEVVSQAVDDAGAAFGPFQSLVAPVEDLRGFSVVFAVGLWLMVMFSDLAAARSDAPFQAVLPQLAAFIFSSVLLLGRHAALATILFVSALALYRLAVRNWRVHQSAPGQVAGSAVWTVGLPVLVLVLLSALAFSSAAPTGRGGVVDLRAIGRGPDAREVDSPLVSLDSLLGEQSNEVLFTVESERPHYWRLTSLDEFNGRSWSASSKYRDIDDGDALPEAWGDLVAPQQEELAFELQRLSSAWLPTAFAPATVRAPVSLRFDQQSGSVIVAEDDAPSNMSYEVTAAVAEVDRATLQQAPSTPDERFADARRLPNDLPAEIRRQANEITAGLAPFDAATALEAYFRRNGGFVYDREVNYRDSDEALLEFLQLRRGFCQQFATAFAVMARAAGLPSRVAVGFTYGDAEETLDSSGESSTTTWTVRGRFAHAWPEVHIQGVGWVAFEPTPGRGNPDSTSYSDIAPSQGGVEPNTFEELGATTTTTTTIAAVPGQPVPTTLPDELPPLPEPAQPTGPAVETSNTPTIVLLGIVGSVLLVVALVRLRIVSVRRRRRLGSAGGADPSARVEASWRRACRDLARVDIRSRPSETPIEFARRAAKLVEVEGVRRLGRYESDRRFRGRPLDDAEAENAEAITEDLREVVWSRLERRERLAAEMDIGPRGVMTDG
ncbi:MAG: DUF3488 and transglutaminase-like domain-containing protein [Microthrixaceae bacterium]|nr:DUF3488 and transglutaminase-like domain-containing protein [Microthrixaceae bacterium]